MNRNKTKTGQDFRRIQTKKPLEKFSGFLVYTLFAGVSASPYNVLGFDNFLDRIYKNYDYQKGHESY